MLKFSFTQNPLRDVILVVVLEYGVVNEVGSH